MILELRLHLHSLPPAQRGGDSISGSCSQGGRAPSPPAPRGPGVEGRRLQCFLSCPSSLWLRQSPGEYSGKVRLPSSAQTPFMEWRLSLGHGMLRIPGLSHPSSSCEVEVPCQER